MSTARDSNSPRSAAARSRWVSISSTIWPASRAADRLTSAACAGVRCGHNCMKPRSAPAAFSRSWKKTRSSTARRFVSVMSRSATIVKRRGPTVNGVVHTRRSSATVDSLVSRVTR